ncbi:WecB/TagA/CpsF family glycosyltransferase [Bradyrhizobium tropiciagri]|nr:WecB/TagA/CpsF family glycosyltransferase [Bradyrhizobium tropiciagri]MBR0874901.1 WecB/TagA/CpsF family glycosyltransferase [Bradyrhizobium tropiciagri]
MRIERGDVLGVNVCAITIDDAVAAIEHWIREECREYVCITGVHGVMECRRDPSLRQIHNQAGMVTPDGVPLVYFLRLIGKTKTQRVYGPDLMREMMAVSARRGYRQFFYGGDVGLAEKLEETLVKSVPGLQVAGTLCPPFREMTPEEDRATVDAINAARPDIVWVGLSTPKQERWMAAHLGRIEAPVMIGVGAAFDFLAGTKRQAPKWMQRHALEWLFRLCSEPRRLWRRYAYIVPRFMFLASGALVRRAVTTGSEKREIAR